jgi:hypothetical protein
MAYKLLDAAQDRWRIFNGAELVKELLDEAKFKDGKQVKQKPNNYRREGSPPDHPYSPSHPQHLTIAQATAVLNGHARTVAGIIRRKATNARLGSVNRKIAEEAVAYLPRKAVYLDYLTALEHGWPIASGIIEGACRHIVKDRIDLTGAR